MKRWSKTAVVAFSCSLLLPILAQGSWAQLNTGRIEELTGAKGKMDAKEPVFKVSLPRSDLKVESQGVKITPPFGVTAWAAFQEFGKQTMMMGDMVLTEDQVAPAMDAALQNGLEVTALHNHFLWESPRMMFMHIGGMGDPEKLASAVGKVFGEIRKTPPKTEAVSIAPAKTQLSVDRLNQVIGHSGDLNQGIYKVVIGRKAKMHGHEIGNAMGVNTWAAFSGTDQQAAVDGDFAMLEGEVQGVLKALRAAGIRIVAIHNHMTGESPRIVFLHYWGIGPAEALAKGVRAGLDTQKQ